MISQTWHTPIGAVTLTIGADTPAPIPSAAVISLVELVAAVEAFVATITEQVQP